MLFEGRSDVQHEEQTAGMTCSQIALATINSNDALKIQSLGHYKFSGAIPFLYPLCYEHHKHAMRGHFDLSMHEPEEPKGTLLARSVFGEFLGGLGWKGGNKGSAICQGSFTTTTTTIHLLGSSFPVYESMVTPGGFFVTSP